MWNGSILRKMGYEIDDEVVAKAASCGKERRCLSGAIEPSCTPIQLMRGSDDEAALIRCPEDKGCQYCHSFGNTHICQCPVRLAIFRRYGK